MQSTIQRWRLPWAIAFVMSVTPGLRAQAPTLAQSRGPVYGVRQQRARYVVLDRFNLWAAATDDGLIEIWSEPDRQSRTVRPTDPKTIREFFAIEDVERWADTVDALSRVRAAERYSHVRTPAHFGRRLEAWYASNEPGNLSIVVALEGCPRGGTARVTLGPDAMQTWLAALRGAAEDARIVRDATGPTTIPDPTRAYYYHATGCTAEPFPSNPVPTVPDAGQPRRGYEVLSEFVVDSSGSVVPGSLRVSGGADVQYVAAVENVLPQWRFTAPSRGGRKTSQVVHMPVRFDPSAGSSEPSCIEGPTRGLAPRIAMRNSRTDKLPSSYLTTIARRLALYDFASGRCVHALCRPALRWRHRHHSAHRPDRDSS
jgi:hypothetical protein